MTAPAISDAEILALAHRIATKYTHRSDPTSHSYGFMQNTLIQFARAVLDEQKSKSESLRMG